MTRLRPVHVPALTRREAELQDAVMEDLRGGDFCSTKGAARLKRRLEQFWKARGYDVAIELVPGRKRGDDETVWRVDVRSDMVNGLPLGALQ